MNFSQANNLAAALKAARSALEADWPELRAEISALFRDRCNYGTGLSKKAEELAFLQTPECRFDAAKKAQKLAFIAEDLASLRNAVQSFDGDAVIAAKKAEVAKVAAAHTTFWAARSARIAAAKAACAAAEAAMNDAREACEAANYAVNTLELHEASFAAEANRRADKCDAVFAVARENYETAKAALAAVMAA